MSLTEINAVFNNLTYWMPLFALICPAAACLKVCLPRVAACWTSNSGVEERRGESEFSRNLLKNEFLHDAKPHSNLCCPQCAFTWRPGGTWSLIKPADNFSPTKFITIGLGCFLF